MAKKSKRKAPQSSRTAQDAQMPTTYLGLPLNDVRTAYAWATAFLPQDPRPQGSTTTVNAAGAQVPSGGGGHAGLVSPRHNAIDGKFTFGDDDHATFDFAAPPGPGIAAALPASSAGASALPAANRTAAPGGSALAQPYWPGGSDLVDFDYTTDDVWSVFVSDLFEILCGTASSFEEIWTRYYPTATDPSSAAELGPHAQENQNILPRHIPTPEEFQTMMDWLLIASLPHHADDPVKPKSQRNKSLSTRNGRTTRVRTSTHTHPCKKCAVAGTPSWHASKKSLKRHEDNHDREPQACILCGKTIDGRGDMPGTHRREARCAVYTELYARGKEEMVSNWALFWDVQDHAQWGSSRTSSSRW